MATNFVDGTTPLDATAFNGIEDEIEEVRGRVDELNNRISTITDYVADICEFAESLSFGTTWFRTNSSTTNLPNNGTGYNYSSGFVIKRTTNAATVVLFSYNNPTSVGGIALRNWANNTWYDWYIL